jgi:hypothetical protein
VSMTSQFIGASRLRAISDDEAMSVSFEGLMHADCVGWDQHNRFEVRTDRSPVGAGIKGADSRGARECVGTDREGLQ